MGFDNKGVERVRKITLDQLERDFELIQCPLTGNPPITKRKEGYSIRVLKSIERGWDGRQSIKMDYFETDLDGVILSSPRGMAKNYNKKVQIRDLADAFNEAAK